MLLIRRHLRQKKMDMWHPKVAQEKEKQNLVKEDGWTMAMCGSLDQMEHLMHMVVDIGM